MYKSKIANHSARGGELEVNTYHKRGIAVAQNNLQIWFVSST